jgi:AcrR family transcriptional regulator
MEMSPKSANKRTSGTLASDVQAKPEGKPRARVLKKVVTETVADKPLAAVAAPEPKPAAAIPSGVRRVRSNRRSEQTIANILTATENIVLESGAERVSILDVCRAADISRGTFYRYFASQDELLDAFSRHKRERFHRALAEAVESYDDPDERFAALVRYLDHYLEHGRARRLLVVAPEYAFGFFRRIFHDSVVRFQDVLAIVFDAWEARLGVQLDRELVCEMMIRYVLSELLVPGDTDRKTVPRRIARMVESLTSGASPRARR